MSLNSWYPFYPGDYARDTKHLTMLEHGAYRILLDHYYATGKPLLFSNRTAIAEQSHSNRELLPDHSRLYRICSATNKQEQEAVDSVLDMFFEWTENGYINHRAIRTIEEQHSKYERRSRAGKAGAKARHSSKPIENKRKSVNRTGNALAMPKQPEPEPEPDVIVSDTKVSSCTECTYPTKDGRFFSWPQIVDYLWNDYPRVGRTIRGKSQFEAELKKHIEKEGRNGTDWKERIGFIAGRIREYRKYCEATGEKQPDPHRWLRNKGFDDEYRYSEVQTKQHGGRKAGDKGNPMAALELALSDQSRRSSGCKGEE